MPIVKREWVETVELLETSVSFEDGGIELAWGKGLAWEKDMALGADLARKKELTGRADLPLVEWRTQVWRVEDCDCVSEGVDLWVFLNNQSSWRVVEEARFGLQIFTI